MSRFHSEVDRRCDSLRLERGRDLFWDEVQGIEDGLLVEWLTEGRFDDLIDHALDEFETRDGDAFCASLGEALARGGDRRRFSRLFCGLAKTREAAFWRTWPAAQDGQIGGMRESARHLAATLEAMAGLWHCYWKVGDEAGMANVRENMQRVQARQKPSKGKGLAVEP